MPFRRYLIDLAIPLDAQGKLPPVLNKKLNEVLEPAQLQALANMELVDVVKTMIQKLKEFSVKINEGMDREEETIRAKWHLCKHDIGQSCDGEEDI